MIKVAPSMLAADFSYLSQDVDMVNDSVADWFHLDVMDGVFVPNISFGMPVIAAIAKQAEKPLDIHLMISQPERYLQEFVTLGAEILTVHYEACIHLHRTLSVIKDLGALAGVALNPHTPVSVLVPIIQDVDLVCLMSVNPGFGGQRFIPYTYEKIIELRTLIRESKSNAIIEIDGGVTINNSKKLSNCGADILVAGSVVFSSENPIDTIAHIKSCDN